MVSLRAARADELPLFVEFQTLPHARRFVIEMPMAEHRRQFADPHTTYLAIESKGGELVGYFVLVSEPDTGSVEFRRIVLLPGEPGAGQAAIRQMERYCIEELGARRIWLDVFEDNGRARHIYGKLGYRLFDETRHEGRRLLLMEKWTGEADGCSE